MDVLKELKRNLEKQIEEINNKSDISPTELDRLDKAVDILKDIETICAMKEYGRDWEEEEDMEYSGRYPYYMRDGGRSYAPMQDRRRDRNMMPWRSEPRNSYSYGYGYSGQANKEQLMMDLREMMNMAKSEKERLAIQQLLEQWKE